MPILFVIIILSTMGFGLVLPPFMFVAKNLGASPMMAAFIVAVRGTVGQAVLLGLAATLSHTLVVWAIALGGLYLWLSGKGGRTPLPYGTFLGAGALFSLFFQGAVWAWYMGFLLPGVPTIVPGGG